MEKLNIYKDIAQRTNGDIYVGVVGPVRTGKSTFIKKFMDTLVVPNIKNISQRERAIDELPQSAAGKTIMTTEPKFVPEDAAKVNIDDKAVFNARLIDCVGYIVPSALGYIENKMPRMVMTPWFDEEIPFNMAAEIGTKKVITDHCTIGLVVTTDGSITDIDRSEYEEAEERVINELQELGKPFIVLLNSLSPYSKECIDVCNNLAKKYKVSVLPVNCLEMSENEIKRILVKVLFEFPVKEIKVDMPKWLSSLEKEHWLRKSVYSQISDSSKQIKKIKEIEETIEKIKNCEYIIDCSISHIDLGTGKARISLSLENSLFYKVLGEKTGIDIKDDCGLMNCIADFAKIKDKYDKIASAYEDVSETGYGIVLPSMEELHLDEPQIVKQGGKYGIKLKASAPSVHMIKTKITTEVTPIVGSEQQSEELVLYLLREFEENPSKIWESNIFGKSLHELVNEGLHNKLYRMPTDARGKLRETIEKIINEGCSGLICIIL